MSTVAKLTPQTAGREVGLLYISLYWHDIEKCFNETGDFNAICYTIYVIIYILLRCM